MPNPRKKLKKTPHHKPDRANVKRKQEKPIKKGENEKKTGSLGNKNRKKKEGDFGSAGNASRMNLTRGQKRGEGSRKRWNLLKPVGDVHGILQSEPFRIEIRKVGKTQRRRYQERHATSKKATSYGGGKGLEGPRPSRITENLIWQKKEGEPQKGVPQKNSKRVFATRQHKKKLQVERLGTCEDL